MTLIFLIFTFGVKNETNSMHDTDITVRDFKKAFIRTLTAPKHGTFGTPQKNTFFPSSRSPASLKFNSKILNSLKCKFFFFFKLCFSFWFSLFMQVCSKSRPLHSTKSSQRCQISHIGSKSFVTHSLKKKISIYYTEN